MKKRLLFSLLLGSAFVLMNDLYAEKDAEVPEDKAVKVDKEPGASTADKKDPAVEKSTEAKPAEEQKKYEVVVYSSNDGKTYTKEAAKKQISFYKKNDKTIYQKIPVMDSAITQDMPDTVLNGKGGKHHSGPYVPGVDSLPEGYTFVNVWVKIDKGNQDQKNNPKFENLKGIAGSGDIVIANAEELLDKKEGGDPEALVLQIEGAQKNIDATIEGYNIPADHYWALMNEKGEIFIPEVKIPDQAKDFLQEAKYSQDGVTVLKDQAFTRYYEIPDVENTKKLQDLQTKLDEVSKQLEEAKAKGGSADPKEVEELKAQIEQLKKDGASKAAVPVNPNAAQSGTLMVDGMGFTLLSNTQLVKENPELFAKLKIELATFAKGMPKAFTELCSLALVDEGIDDKGKPKGHFRVVKIQKKFKDEAQKSNTVVAEFLFASDTDYQQAHRYVMNQKQRYYHHENDLKTTAERSKVVTEGLSVSLDEHNDKAAELNATLAQAAAEHEAQTQALTAVLNQKAQEAEIAKQQAAAVAAQANQIIAAKDAQLEQEKQKTEAVIAQVGEIVNEEKQKADRAKEDAENSKQALVSTIETLEQTTKKAAATEAALEETAQEKDNAAALAKAAQEAAALASQQTQDLAAQAQALLNNAEVEKANLAGQVKVAEAKTDAANTQAEQAKVAADKAEEDKAKLTNIVAQATASASNVAAAPVAPTEASGSPEAVKPAAGAPVAPTENNVTPNSPDSSSLKPADDLTLQELTKKAPQSLSKSLYNALTKSKPDAAVVPTAPVGSSTPAA